LGLVSTVAYDQIILPDGHAYVATGTPALQIYDLNFLARAPVLSGSLLVRGGASGQTRAEAGYAYSPVFEDGISVFDLTDPLQPQFLSKYDEFRYNISIAPMGQYAYTGDVQYGAVRVLDVSNPAALEEVGMVQLDPEQNAGLGGVVVAGNYAYGTFSYVIYDDQMLESFEYGTVTVVDIQNPSDPQVVARYEVESLTGALAVNGNYLYVVLSGELLDVIDISNPLTPVRAAVVPLPGRIESLSVSGSTLFAAAGIDGIHLFDLTHPAAPAFLTTVDTPSFASAVTHSDDNAYVADGISGVQVVDVHNPAAPMLIGSADTIGSVRGVFVYDEYLYAVTDYGIEVLKTVPAITAN
jgi:hypothetical protein